MGVLFSQSKIQNLKSKISRGLRYVFVASTRAIHDEKCIGRKRWCDLNHVRDGVRRFEGRDNSLGFGERLKGAQRFVVGGVNVFDSFFVAQITVLGADRGVIESGGNRMRELDLAVVIRQHERFCALKDAEPPAWKTRGVFAGRNPFAARFDADHADRFVSKKRMEQSDGIAAAANARDEKI